MPKIVIDIKLDSVPGWGYTVEDFVEYFKSDRSGIPHYIRGVEVMPEETCSYCGGSAAKLCPENCPRYTACILCTQPGSDTTVGSKVRGVQYPCHSACKAEDGRRTFDDIIEEDGG